jgi:acetate kinase
MNILVFNSGSTSIKVSLYSFSEQPIEAQKANWSGKIDWSNRSGMAEFSIKTITEKSHLFSETSESHNLDIHTLISYLWTGETQAIDHITDLDIVGHRIVQGRIQDDRAVWITQDVMAEIAQCAAIAPLHNQAALSAIQIMTELLPNIRQIAVFDSSFHRHLSPEVYTYPGPYAWLDEGIRRYGFHGISHEYCAQRSAQLLSQDVNNLQLITAHLGGGCSLAAIQHGRSVNTTMGFTPLDGLMMGTRSGSIDPSILIYLIRHHHYSADQLEHLLNHQSGLLGISGLSSDMRQIQTAIQQGNDRAKLAFDLYIHHLRSAIGSMRMSLETLDALIFTGGVGENSAEVRAATCQSLQFLGIELDPIKNISARSDCDISTSTSQVKIFVVHTQEDWAIAQEASHLFKSV